MLQQPTFIMKRSIMKFRYLSPTTLSETVALLEKFDGKAVLLAGGTDLLLFMKYRTLIPECVINIKNIVGMDRIQQTQDGGLEIGALTTLTKIGESKIIEQKYHALHQSATESFWGWQIRNMATIGGNICRSSPAADTVPPLIAFDANVKLVGPKGERKVPLENFFTGPNQNILDQEILTQIIIPPQKGRYGSAFKSLKRTAVDVCKLVCAVKVVMNDNKCGDIRIALGSVGPTPLRAKKAEESIKGKEVNDYNIEVAAQKVAEDISPITDGRSTAEYRRSVSLVLVERSIKHATERIQTA